MIVKVKNRMQPGFGFLMYFFNEKKEFFLLHNLHNQNLDFIKALNMNWGILFIIFSTIFINLQSKRHPKIVQN